MEKKEYITPDSICLEPSVESPFMDEMSFGEEDLPLGAKKLTDKLFDDEEEL